MQGRTRPAKGLSYLLHPSLCCYRPEKVAAPSVPHHTPVYHRNHQIFEASSLARFYRKKHSCCPQTIDVNAKRSLHTVIATQFFQFFFVFFLPLAPTTTIIIACHLFTKTLGALPFVESFALRAADGSSWNYENVLSNKGFLNPNQKKSGDLSLLGASVRNTLHPPALSRRRLQAVSVCSPALWL